MRKSYRFILYALVFGAFLLSACSGTAPQQADSPGGSTGTLVNEVVFTGTVQSMGGAQWMISGQSVDVDGSTTVDSTVQVGDIVRVEANVSQDGAVLATKIESSQPNDDPNANDSNSNDDNANEDDGNTNGNTNGVDDNSNANANSNDGMDDEDEVFGTVDSITVDSITIGGVTYAIASFTEFKNIISVGDQVKIHVIVNSDGTLTIREIEKSTGGDEHNSNFNGNSNGDDDSIGNSNRNSNDDDSSNSNTNDNDDHDDDDGNSNDNDD